jgi:hypothetical protein
MEHIGTCNTKANEYVVAHDFYIKLPIGRICMGNNRVETFLRQVWLIYHDQRDPLQGKLGIVSCLIANLIRG